jgi:hypothetical protein
MSVPLSAKFEYAPYWRTEVNVLGLCPARWLQADRDFGFTANRISYAITDVKADIARLDKEFSA